MEWKPIEQATLKPKKGYFRLYSYSAEQMRQTKLQRSYRTDCIMGFRKCDFYMDIPIIKEQQS